MCWCVTERAKVCRTTRARLGCPGWWWWWWWGEVYPCALACITQTRSRQGNSLSPNPTRAGGGVGRCPAQFHRTADTKYVKHTELRTFGVAWCGPWCWVGHTTPHAPTRHPPATPAHVLVMSAALWHGRWTGAVGCDGVCSERGRTHLFLLTINAESMAWSRAWMSAADSSSRSGCRHGGESGDPVDVPCARTHTRGCIRVHIAWSAPSAARHHAQVEMMQTSTVLGGLGHNGVVWCGVVCVLCALYAHARNTHVDTHAQPDAHAHTHTCTS